MTHPCRGSPCHCEGGNVQANECNHGSYGISARLGSAALSRSDSDNGHNVLTDHHESASCEENLSASQLFHNVEGDGRGAYIDQCCDELDEKGIADSAQTLEEDDAEVGDEVDTLDVG